MKQHIEHKIADQEELLRMLARWRFRDQRIVFTNGCFDLIHRGHIEYLVQARALGDHLVVGLNTDDSVKRLKGAHRPIKDLDTRLHVLASFVFVDAVISFNEDTPMELIRTLRPDVLVKGGDWKPEQIVGGEFVQSYGGEVMSLPFVEGYSTTLLEEKIRSRK
jgi:rfaE bifunctional protein nucleotidyltransferase chain/domain